MPAGREVASVLEILGLVVLLLVIVGAGAADAGDEYGDGGGDERWRTFVNNAIFGVVLVCFDGKVFFYIFQLLLLLRGLTKLLYPILLAFKVPYYTFR